MGVDSTSPLRLVTGRKCGQHFQSARRHLPSKLGIGRISETTFYECKAKYAGMTVSEAAASAYERGIRTNRVKFQQRYVMSHRNVVNCLWAKAFGQFCSSHGDHPVSRSVLGA